MAHLRGSECKVDAVLFDFANTLVPLEDFGPNVFVEVLRDHDLDPDPVIDEFLRSWGRLDPHLTLRGVMARASSASRSADLAAEFWKRFTTRSLTAPEIFGASALLAQLHSQGVALGLISQVHRRDLDAQLSVRSWRCYFDEVLAYEDFVVPKPHPHAHQAMMRLLKVDPDRVLALEHSSVGLRAANSAGIATVHMGCPNEVLCREDATIHAHDFTDLEFEDLSATA